ncbi:MAG: hypothetical protein WCH99_05040 [Verrucomicrobiota bacterium]
MTEPQRISLQARWWPAACRAQNWKTGDRNLRLRVCAWAVSLQNPTQLTLLEAINSDRQPDRWLESTNDLDNKSDVDRVKACLGMLADNLKAADEVGRPQIGVARRKRDVIRSSLKCLALYEAQPRRFLASLVNDMFNHGRPGVTIKDLTGDPNIKAGGKEGPSDLQRLMMRMQQVVNDKRNANVLVPPYTHLQGAEPLTIHEMKWTAGVQCNCKFCDDLRARGKAPLLPPLPVVENMADFDPELEPASDADCELGAGVSEETVNPF